MAMMLFCLPSALCAAFGQTGASDDPLVMGQFRWTLGKPVFKPEVGAVDHCFSVKDPTVVRHEGRWHVFYTVRRAVRTHSIEYVSFTDWPDMASAERHVLQCREGYFCAPQVFYFRPHEKWYLVYQVVEQDRKPGLQPAFSTSENIADPRSWTPAALFFPEQPEGASKWIDFWVICDEDRAHLFFTSMDGRLWRSSTALSDFPRNFGPCEVVLRAGDESWRLFEAAHIYRLQGASKYLAVIEGIRKVAPSGRRFHVAYTAERLEGEWTRLAASVEQPFASFENVEQPEEYWTDYISHGELIRAGYDETLTVDPSNLQFLFQGVSAQAAAGKKYGEIPWRLGLLKRVAPR